MIKILIEGLSEKEIEQKVENFLKELLEKGEITLTYEEAIAYLSLLLKKLKEKGIEAVIVTPNGEYELEDAIGLWEELNWNFAIY